MIERKDVDNLAALARLAVDDGEKDKLAKDLESILGYISELTKAPKLPSADKPAYWQFNRVRSDDHPYPAGSFSVEILANAPERREDYFVVKKILGGSEESDN